MDMELLVLDMALFYYKTSLAMFLAARELSCLTRQQKIPEVFASGIF
jgi:hypothetical protein